MGIGLSSISKNLTTKIWHVVGRQQIIWMRAVRKGLDEHGGRVDFWSDSFPAMMKIPIIRRRQREDVVVWWRESMMSSIIFTREEPCSVGREIR